MKQILNKNIVVVMQVLCPVAINHVALSLFALAWTMVFSLAVGSSHYLRLARKLVLGLPGPFQSSSLSVITRFSSC